MIRIRVAAASRGIPPADLAALTERVRRRVIRWFRLARLLDAAAAAAQASASLPRGVCTQPQAQAGRHGAGNRECRQAARRRDRRAYRRRSRHSPSTTRTQNQPTARPVPNRTGRERCQEPFSCFLGRPRGRTVDSRPSRLTTRGVHHWSPYGGSTRDRMPDGRQFGLGLLCRTSRWCQRQRLLRRQSSAACGLTTRC